MFYEGQKTGIPAKSSTFVIAGKQTTTTSSGTYTGSTSSGVYVYTRNGAPFYAIAALSVGGYVPRPDFEVVAIDFVNESPTITGEVFSVTATIKNVGETTANPGKVALFINHPDIVVAGESADDVRASLPILEPGQETKVTFSNIKAPGEGGP